MSSNRPINLLRGWPAPGLLPTAAIQTATTAVLTDPAVSNPALLYGQDAGLPALRNEIAEWLARLYPDATRDPARICITGGASQNLARILQSYSDPAYTRAVWVIAPCYFLACPVFADAGLKARVRAVPEDEDGLDIAVLEAGLRRVTQDLESEEPESRERCYKSPKSRKLYRHIVYGVPTCANPSGKSMTTQRRQELVRLARRYNMLIITDDVYDYLQWPTDSSSDAVVISGGEWPRTELTRPAEMCLPRLSDVDRTLELTKEDKERDPLGFGYTVSNGSFSKIIGPGMRSGWIDASPAFAAGLSQTGSTKSGGSPSQLTAAIVCEMLKTGQVDKHIETVIRPSLQHRHRMMVEAAEKHLGPLGVTWRKNSLQGFNLYGGYFFWITLPDRYLASIVAEQARETKNLIVAQGGLFAVQGDEKAAQFKHNIRLCFSWETEHDIVEGVERLAAVIKSMEFADRQS